MALIIPDSSLAVLEGQNAFRLNVPLQSPGDIFESVVGASAFAIGPLSDIASVLINYFDPTVIPTSVGQVIISPDRWFLGTVFARNETVYPVSQRKGRILISPNDIFDPNFTSLFFDPATDIQVYVTPVLDVIQYFSQPPAFTPQRSDKVFQFQYLLAPPVPGVNAATFLYVPAYGRKSGFFSFRNQDPAETIDVTLYGAQMSTSQSPGIRGSYEKTLHNAAVLANGSTDYEYKCSTDGLFDLFVIQLENYRGNAMPITITLSDDPL